MSVHRSFTRRQFLRGAAAAGAASLSAAGASTLGGCRGDDEPGTSRDTTGSGVPTTRHTTRLRGDPFALGVASGDPLPDRVVLWTRLAPTPLAGGLAGMADDRVDVIWQVAREERFTNVVSRGTATAEPANAHTVRVDVTGLDPASNYFYRFTVGEWTSRVGRTRTAADPGGSLRRLRLGVVCCQFLGTGHYAAYRHLLDEDLDLVVHLGDYIYELPSGNGERAVLPHGVPTSLDDYRLRHASYRADPDLQSAHARYPFMCMWDDHEVTNNYAGDSAPRPPASAEVVRRLRGAAYRAYWEHLPLRLGPPDGADLTLYRTATFGELARLYLLDERQYADEPPCRDTSVSDLGNCPARREERRYLGDDQDQWLAAALTGATGASDGTGGSGGSGGTVAWNLVGNPTVLAGINMGSGSAPSYYLETWDGYPVARRRFLDRLADDRVTNPVVLSGDWHAGMVNDVHRDPEDRATPVVATELMTPAISSPLYEAPRAHNPQIRHQVLRHGYLTVQIEPERLTAAFRVLDDVTRADSGISTDSTWQLIAGDPRAAPLTTT